MEPEDIRRTLGRYEIQRQLGAGAMGTVYLARDTQLEREVAIKIPRFTGEHAEELRERFAREARAAAAVHHPNICPVHDVSEIDGRQCLVMAYIEGHPLSRVLEGGKKPTAKAVSVVIRKLALALEHAHRHGVVHRDLKPANVMVDRRGEPIVMDFGLACRVSGHSDARITQEGFLVGSPAYMSPEQVDPQATPVGPSSDIYSLGVVMFELLTRRLPYEGSVAEVVFSKVAAAPPKPSDIAPDIDPALESICLRMMARRPEDRYATMRDVAGALGEFLKSLRSGGEDERARTGELDSSASTESMNAVMRHIARDAEASPALLNTIPPRRRVGTIAAAAAGAVLLAGIVITIVRRDGSQQRIDVPDAARIEISNSHPVSEKTPSIANSLDTGEMATAGVDAKGDGTASRVQSVSSGSAKTETAPGDEVWAASPQLKQLARLPGHDQRVSAIGFTDDGKQIVTASRTGDDFRNELRFWDVATRTLLGSVSLDAGIINRVVAHPDGRHLLLGGQLGAAETTASIHLFDLTRKAIVRTFAVGSAVGRAWDLSRDGKTLVYRKGEREIAVWDMEKNDERKRIGLDELNQSGRVFLTQLSPNGKRAAIHMRGESFDVFVLDLESGMIVSQLLAPKRQWYSMDWSSDGSMVLMYGDSGRITLWNADTGNVLKNDNPPARRDAGDATIRFLPDDRHFVVGQREGVVRLFDSEARREIASGNAPPGTTTFLALSPDGKLVATAEGFVRPQHSSDDPSRILDCDVRVWQLPDPNALPAESAEEKGSWTELFDGKSKEGWEGGAGWKLEEGLLVGRKAGNLSYLKETFDNVHVRVECRLESGTGHIGVRDSGDGKFPGYGTDLTAEGTGSGGISKMVNPLQQKAIRGQWVTVDLIALGDTLRVFLDGKLTAESNWLHQAVTKGRVVLSASGQTQSAFLVRSVRVRRLAVPARPPETILLATAESSLWKWNFKTSDPGVAWTLADFDDSSWQTGPGGLGRSDVWRFRPLLRTDWSGGDLWLRKSFELSDIPRGEPVLRLFLQGISTTQVHLNGVPLLRSVVSGGRYHELNPSGPEPEGGWLKKGRNVLAIRVASDPKQRVWLFDAGLSVVELPDSESLPENDEQGEKEKPALNGAGGASSGRDREAASVVLKAGGIVSGRTGDRNFRAMSPKDLPETDFVVSKIILRNVDVKSEELKRLERLSSLRLIDFEGARLSDAELASLPDCGSLETLILTDTPITAARLSELARYPGLKRIVLSKGRASTTVLTRLKEAMPNCRIEFAAPAPIARMGPWQKLFNGRDLSAWKVRGNQWVGDWKVEDGLLVGSGGGNWGWIASEGIYGDFDIRLEYRLLEPNAAPQVCLRSGPRNNQIDALPAAGDLRIVLKSEGKSANAPSESLETGALRGLASPREPIDVSLQDWHFVEIRIVGSRVIASIDDEQSVDVELVDFREKYDGTALLWRPSGFVGIRNPLGKAEFRNIEIRPLIGKR